MSKISVTEARSALPAVIKDAQTEAVFLEKHGKIQAVVVSSEQYERLITALEDAEDLEAYDEAMADPSPSIPWEQMREELGW